ncbi:MAG: isochorismatase family protein [Alphaproteobacteria bacterium]
MAIDRGNKQGIVERDQSCLAVIDVQQFFVDRLPLHERGPLVARIGWLMRVARALGIPILATAEDVDRNGPLMPELSSLLPTGTTIFNKMIYGLDRQKDIKDEVERIGRGTVVLVGLETDVCIAHSALGLEAAGYRSVVIDDACSSPMPHHEHGLRRLRDAGVTVTSVKGIFYEWSRDLATSRRVKSELNVPVPAGLTL